MQAAEPFHDELLRLRDDADTPVDDYDYKKCGQDIRNTAAQNIHDLRFGHSIPSTF